jgi:hypothetical protein
VAGKRETVVLEGEDDAREQIDAMRAHGAVLMEQAG